MKELSPLKIGDSVRFKPDDLFMREKDISAGGFYGTATNARNDCGGRTIIDFTDQRGVKRSINKDYLEKGKPNQRYVDRIKDPVYQRKVADFIGVKVQRSTLGIDKKNVKTAVVPKNGEKGAI